MAVGSVPVTWDVRLTPDKVPPNVKFPDVVTVPVRVIPLTVPVPPTEVTVPPVLLLLIVWLGQEPVMVTFVPATNAGVAVPVPPLATANVPPRVNVPLVVIGLPEKVNPVVPPEPATEVTVPPEPLAQDKVPLPFVVND